MAHQKFDVRKLERLNDTGRFETLSPDVMWEALAAPAEWAVVEIGAGTALFASAFALKSPGTTFYAVDTQDVMLEWIRANRHEVAEGIIVPVKAREDRVPLDDAVAGAVYMINLHHELAHPAVTYAEAFRLLEPGGRLLVSDWAPQDSPKGPPLAIRVSADSVEDELRSTGFVNIRTHDGALPYNWLITATKST